MLNRCSGLGLAFEARDRLAFLEDEGIVSREIVATMPPWVEYELTERGRELGLALAPLGLWGRRHMARVVPPVAAPSVGVPALEALAIEAPRCCGIFSPPPPDPPVACGTKRSVRNR